MCITRERARQIATDYLAAPGEKGWPISKIVSVEELAPRTPQLYGCGTDPSYRIEECWIAYLDPATALRSNTILLISKESGKVVFFGSADDQV